MATAAYGTGGQDMAIGRVLSRAFAAIGAAPILFLGISLVLVAVPSVVSSLLFAGGAASVAGNPNGIGAVLPILLSSAVVWWLLYMAAQAMLFRATAAEIDGRPQRFGNYAAAAAGVLPAMVGLAIVVTVLVWIGLALFVVPGIILALMWSVAAPALAIERIGVFGAMKRSRALTKGARWRVLGLVIVVFAIYFVASAVIGLGAVAVNGFEQGAARSAPSVLGSILSVALQTGFVTVWSAIQAALYVDLRDTRDGPAGEQLADIFA